MPLATITLAPGVDVEKTVTLNAGSWSLSNLVRFREGLPEKNGGWQRLVNQLVIGTARALEEWADLSGIPYLAIGTNQQLEVLSGGTIYNITPIDHTTNSNPAFTTTLNSTSVKITDAGGLPAPGDWVSVLVPVSIGGIVLQGDYFVDSASGNDYFITAASPATSGAGPGGAVPEFTTVSTTTDVTVTLADHGLVANDTFTVQVATTVGGVVFGAYSTYIVTAPVATNTFHITTAVASSSTSGFENAGHARLQYYLPSGNVSAMPSTGYGIGLYGTGLYGTSQAGAVVPPRLWFLDHWGEDLIGNYTGSPIIVWIPPVASGNVAVTVDGTNYPGSIDPPVQVNVSFVSMPQRIMVALGVDPVGGGTQDPNLIRWSNVDDFTDWLATATNQAGSFRLPSGSKIVGGLQSPLFAVIWTDVDTWLMSYIGFPLVFGFIKIDIGTDLLSPKGAGVDQSSVYWVGSNAFFMSDGQSIRILDCPVWDFFFKRLDRQQKDKVFCAINSWFNEVSWYFPSTDGTGEIDSYVRLNTRENVWDYGMLIRTAWTDEGPLGAPIGVDGGNLLQQHEVAFDNDGNPMGEFIQSGFFSIASQTPMGPNAAVSDGSVFTSVKQFLGDFIFDGPTPTVSVTLLFADYLPGTVTSYGPYIFNPAGPAFVVPKGRGRLMAIQIGFSSVGGFWRGGNQRYRGAPSGRR